jgi:hypothetical protein
MDTVCFSETLVSTYESIRRHNTEQHRHLHSRENLKSHDGYQRFGGDGGYTFLMNAGNHLKTTRRHSAKENSVLFYAFLFIDDVLSVEQVT